jgi:hypothetical protein
MRLRNRIPEIMTNFAAFAVGATQFVVAVGAFYILYDLLLEQFFDGSKEIIPLLALWVLTSYLVITRVHRLLSGYYVPNYFVGRVRSSSGLLSDPVNLAFFGDEPNIHAAMQKAGWSKAVKLTPTTALRAAYASIFRRSYPSAPVGTMYLFNKPQDFAYELQVNGNPNQRHHVRFWKTPNGWRLPGGHNADWLAAATHDTHVGIKIATGQLDHIIHSDVDKERDYIIKTLKDTKALKKLDVVKHFTDAYHDRNNGGDRIRTDGSLPFITL